MKNIDEIYNELQDDNELNKTLKEARVEYKKIKKISLIIIVIVDLLMLLFFRESIGSIFTLFFVIITILITDCGLSAVVIYFTKTSKKQIEFIDKYNEKVTKKILNNFYDNVEFYPEKEMPEYIYEQVNEYEYYNIYLSDNYFEALINNKYSIQMAEVETEEKVKVYNSQNEVEREDIIILFAKVSMEKSINSEIKIMQDGKFYLEKNKLNMDSSEFEKYFDVKSSNSIIGMQILTSDVMEELVDFENKTKMKYDICINNNELYLRFHSGSFGVNIEDFKNDVLDKSIIRKYFYMINFTYNLSTKLIEVINNIEI